MGFESLMMLNTSKGIDQDAAYRGSKYPISQNRTSLLSLKAKKDGFNSKSGDIEVFGDVIVRSAGGDTLSTDVLKYSPDSELVTTDEEITLKSGSTTIKGKGLLMDIKNNRVVIKSDVDVMFYNSQLKELRFFL